MAYLYILQSLSSSRYYIGSTADLHRRLSEHHRGHSLATRGRGPRKLVYAEEFPALLEARRRELELKKWKSAMLIAAMIAAKKG